VRPSFPPTLVPTIHPTAKPSTKPSTRPSFVPVVPTGSPTVKPSEKLFTAHPSLKPTLKLSNAGLLITVGSQVYNNTDFSLTVLETSSAVVYFIQLRAVPTSSVVVLLTGNGSQFASPNIILFDQLTWDQQKPILLTFSNDYVERSNQIFTLHHQFQTNDSFYSQIISPTLVLTVVNVNTAGINVSPSNIVIVASETGASLSPGAFYLSLNSKPTSTVFVSVGAFAPQFLFSLKRAVFSHLNYSTAVRFQVSASTLLGVGVNNSIAITSSSQDLHYNGLSLSVLVYVQRTTDSVAPPAFLYSQFKDSAEGANAYFNAPTNKAGLTGTFACSKLLANTEQFGSGSVCSWLSNSELWILFGTKPTVLPGDMIVLQNNLLKSSDPKSSSFSNGLSTPILAPSNPVLAVAIVSAPATVGLCSPLTLDGSLSTGGGGRALHMTWTIVNVQPVHTSTSSLSSFLFLASFNSSVSLTLNSSLLLSGTTYTFNLQVTNFLQSTSSQNITVKKSKFLLPNVIIEGPAFVYVFQSDTLSLQADASQPQACGTQGISSPMAFSWAEITGTLPSTVRLVSPDPKVMVVAPNSLRSGKKYTFQVTVAMAYNPMLNNTAIVHVVVKRQPLMCIISGGNRQVGTKQDLTLDASPSFDPDSLSGASTFSWRCSQNVSTFSHCYTTSGKLLSISSGETTKIKTGTLEPGTYYFSMAMQKDTRNCTAAVSITVVYGAPPIVNINPLTVAKVNPSPGTFLNLQGQSSAGPGRRITQTQWSLLSGDARSSSSLFSTAPTSTQPNLNAVINLGILTAGSTYVFQLTATDDSRAQGYSNIQIVVNMPPRSGTISCFPAQGYVLETSFKLALLNWVDDASDYPLSFLFLYSYGTYVAGNAATALAGASAKALLATSLPLGSASENNFISVVGVVADQYGGSANATSVVTVLPIAVTSVSALANTASSLITDKLQSGNSQAALLVITSVASMLKQTKKGQHRHLTVDGAPASENSVLRGTLISYLDTASKSMQVSAASFSQQGETLGNIVSVPEEVSHDAVSSALSILGKSVNSSLSSNLNIDRATLKSTAGIVSSLLSTNLFQANSSTTNITILHSGAAVLDAFYSIRSTVHTTAQLNLVGFYPDMPPQSLSTEQVSFVTQRLSLAGASNTSSTVPSFNGRPTTTLTLPLAFPLDFTNLSSLDTSVSSYQINPYQSVSSSQPVNSHITSISISSGGDTVKMSNLSDPFEFTIPLSSPILFNASLVRMGVCRYRENLNTTMTFDCPGGKQSLKCDPKAHPEGVQFNFTCAAVTPTCDYWDEAVNQWNDMGCKMTGISSDGMTITCKCNHLTDFASRMKQTVALAKSIATSKVSLADLLQNATIVVTLLSVFGLFFSGVAWGRYRDLKDRREIVQEDKTPLKLDTDYDGKFKRAVLLLRAWWRGMKENHKLIMAFFGTNSNFTRPQRFTVIFTVIMTNLGVNAFLYIFKGASASSFWVDLENKLVFGLLSTLFSAPLAMIIVLLFKKSGKRKLDEEVYLEKAGEEVPEGLQEVIQHSKEIVEAKAALKAAHESLLQANLRTKERLLQSLKYAKEKGAGGIDPEEKVRFQKEYLDAQIHCKKALISAETAMKRAKSATTQAKFEHRAALEKDMLKVAEQLKGLGKWRAKYQAQRKRAELESLELVGRKERLLLKAEEEELEKLSKVSKMMYKLFVRPIKRQARSKVTLPWWMDYITYVLALGICGVCAWYTLLFSIRLNKCGKCLCYATTCTDTSRSDYSTCVTCTETMISHGPGQGTDWLALQWLQSLIFGLIIGFVIQEPITIFFSKACIPFFAEHLLVQQRKKLGHHADIFAFLDEKVEKELIGPEFRLEDAVRSRKAKEKYRSNKIGMADESETKQEIIVSKGVPSQDIEKLPSHLLESKPQTSHSGSHSNSKVLFSAASSVDVDYEKLGTEETKSGSDSAAGKSGEVEQPRCRLGCGLILQLSDVEAVTAHELTACPERLVPCSFLCGDVIPEKNRVIHESLECMERPVQCAHCKMVFKEKQRDGHESVSCPLLRVCRCGQSIFKDQMKIHRETLCPFRLVFCRFGCGKEMQALHLDTHEGVECHLREWECLCGETFPICEKENHEATLCPQRVVYCQACGSEMVEADRMEHEVDLCILRPWVCGCGEVVPLRDKDQHELYTCTDPNLACLNGCGFFGRTHARHDHQQNECPLRFVFCVCGDAFQAKELQNHKNNYCEERMLTCPLCLAEVSAKNLELHSTNQCMKRVIPCKLGCGRVIVASKEEEHAKTACLKRPVPCKICGLELPFRALEAHEKSTCRVVPCPQCGIVLVKGDLPRHLDGDCSRRPIHCNRCHDSVSLNLFAMHEKFECPLRIVTCEKCKEVLHANQLSQHNSSICPERMVKCKHGCGEKMKANDVELHETRLCQLNSWSCQCGDRMKLVQRKAHLRQCKAYIECWEAVLQQVVESLGKENLERRLAKIMSSRKCSPAVALCALGESGGDVKGAATKLKNRGYYDEMKLVCEVCGIDRYVSAKKKSRKSRKGQKSKHSRSGGHGSRYDREQDDQINPTDLKREVIFEEEDPSSPVNASIAQQTIMEGGSGEEMEIEEL